MDSALQDSRASTSHFTDSTSRPRRISSHGGAGDSSSGRDIRISEALRRLHSDEVVALNGSGLHSRATPEEAVADGETWMDFLRHSHTAGQPTPDQIQRVKERAALIAADRKRRMSEQQEDRSRRRSASNMSAGQIANHRMRHSFSQATQDNPLSPVPADTETQPGPRITDRPLPQRPSFQASEGRRSQESILPHWQPDNEVSACPICGIQFGFLNRRHHCRKCGRVVCASCSPHRITIPRQFIVRSPQEAAAMQRTRTTVAPDIVDLTNDSEDTAIQPPRLEGDTRPSIQDYSIDPALGGGQEVRLCNPCVPDPNPMPHLAYTPSTRYPGASYTGQGRILEISRRLSPGDLSALAHQRPSLARRAPSDRLDGHVANPDMTHSVTRQSSRDASNIPSPVIDRRHSHASRPGERVSQLPPNYQSIFGSAPGLQHDDVSRISLQL